MNEEHQNILRCSIESYPLALPKEKLEFYAVAKLYIDGNEVKSNLGKTYGETMEEAELKLKVLADKWIEDNQ